MPIGTVNEFVWNGILNPINDIFYTIYLVFSLMYEHATPDFPEYVYARLSVIAWLIKFLSSVVSMTATNDTLLNAFNDALRAYSLDYENFTGTIQGTSGMSYIAKYSYIELTNASRRDDAIALAINFSRALNVTAHYIGKLFQFV